MHLNKWSLLNVYYTVHTSSLLYKLRLKEARVWHWYGENQRVQVIWGKKRKETKHWTTMSNYYNFIFMTTERRAHTKCTHAIFSNEHTYTDVIHRRVDNFLVFSTSSLSQSFIPSWFFFRHKIFGCDTSCVAYIFAVPSTKIFAK